MTAARRPDNWQPVWSDEYRADEIARITAADARRNAEHEADRAAYYRVYPDGPLPVHPCHNPRAGWYAQLAED